VGLFKKFAMQCRKPSGRFGRFVGRSMNFGHTKVRQWGLSLGLSPPPEVESLNLN